MDDNRAHIVLDLGDGSRLYWTGRSWSSDRHQAAIFSGAVARMMEADGRLERPKVLVEEAKL
jgi:hypothetical protein